MPLALNGRLLTLEDVVAVARGGRSVTLSPEARAEMRRARAIAEAEADRGEPIYGWTVGVGSRARSIVDARQQTHFAETMLRNHQVAQGPLAPEEVVRAAMLVLANTLARGVTLATPALGELILAALNADRIPAVRSLGSVGAADVAPMVDLGVGLIEQTGYALAPGEGLVLLSSNGYSIGAAALALADCQRLLDTAELAAVCDFEAFQARLDLLSPVVAATRPDPALARTIDRMRRLMAGSELLQQSVGPRFQDPLSYRCTPQVHGAVRGAVEGAIAQLGIDLNTAQTNPVIDVEQERTVRVGNFESLPLALALDAARIGLASGLTVAAERAVKLLQAPHTGLPDGLAEKEGFAQDGIAELDRAIYSLVAEARLLAQPVSFEVAGTSISEGLEDRMTMTPLGARRLAEMVGLGERIMAIKFVIAAQALDLREPRRLSGVVAQARQLIRERIPFVGEGETVPRDLDPVLGLVQSGALGRLVLTV